MTAASPTQPAPSRATSMAPCSAKFEITKSPLTSPPTTSFTDLEAHFHSTLNLCNKLANAEPPASKVAEDYRMSHEVTVAKMLNYCVRMLHADGWHPPTIVRAMVLFEREHDLEKDSGKGKGMRSVMYQALRERRLERHGISQQKHILADPTQEGTRGALVVPDVVDGRGDGGRGRRANADWKRGGGRCNGRRRQQRLTNQADPERCNATRLMDIDAGDAHGNGVVSDQGRKGDQVVSLI